MSGRCKKWLQAQFKAKHGRWPRKARRRNEGVRGRWVLTAMEHFSEIRALKKRWRAYLQGGRKWVFAV